MKTNAQFTKKLLSMVLCLTMVLSYLPTAVFATKGDKTVLDITKGDITINADSISGFAADGTAVTTHDPDGYIIQGNGTETGNVINVTGGTHSIDLNEVIIGSDDQRTNGRSPLTIAANATVTLNLVGENTLGAGWDGYHTVNIVVGDGATLNIDGSGSLSCKESLSYSNLEIGTGGTVEVKGGTVTLRTTPKPVITGSGAFIVSNGNVTLRTDSGSYGGTTLFDRGVSVTVSGGTVTQIDNADAFGAASFELSGGTVIFNQEFSDLPKTNLTSGMLYEAGSLSVYGNQTLSADFEVPSGKSLTVTDGATLTVAEGVTLTNKGTIQNNGSIIVSPNATISGTINGNPEVYRTDSGSIDVTALSSDLKITATGYSMNGKTYLYEGDYTLTGTTSYGVIFEAGEYQLTANNLKIVKGDSYTGSAIELKNGATLHLVLAGDNTLTGGWEGSGIRVNEGTSLTISGNGILRAGYQRGGNAAYGAAIGGYCNSNFGTITINGGTIYATGTRGASIGSGSLYGSSNTMAGTIVINGGTVYADIIGNAQSSGAVLKGSGGTIYCDSVRADTAGLNNIVYRKDGTSAIYYCNDFLVTGDIANCSWDQTNKVLNINGGTVSVFNTDMNTATGQRIYIQGTANVTLDGVNISSTTGAPVEIRDYNDTNVNLTLSGSNTLISTKENTAAIHKSRGQQADNSAAATLTINGTGSLTAVGGSNAAGIGGGGTNGDVHNITIKSGTIHATGNGSAAGIGASVEGSTWKIDINGGYVTASGSPGIGSASSSYLGVYDTNVTGGMVIASSYKGNTPTGGLVSTDGGNTYMVYADYTLNQNLTIGPEVKLTVPEGKTLTVADGVSLTNNGIIVNNGTISGNLTNEGTIYNKGTLPANVGGTVYEQYVKVNNGSGTGNYTEGSTVTITADAPDDGKMFTGWTIELGTINLTDSTKAETTFTMPEGCVIVKANYADIVATITDSNGDVTYYSDEYFAQNEWYNAGGTLTLYTDIRPFHLRIPANGVLDLNRHTMQTDMLIIDQSCTIQNGTISMWHEGIVEEDAVVTFKNVTITNDRQGSWESEITNNGTIIDEGLTLNGVIISGGSVKTGLTEDRVTLSDIPTEGYVYDGTAHEPGVKCGETTLAEGTDYTVTFSHSNGGDSTVNAGTITMTITGIGNYAGTVTKTYTIGKADPGIGAVTAGVVNDTLEISAIVPNRENTNVAGALTVDADQTIVLGQNQIKYTFVPVDTTNYKTVTGTVTVTVTDTVAPVIGGIENGKTYYTTQEVTVTDKNIDTITLNDAPVSGTITLEGNKEAAYTIIATDKAGNTTTVTVKMAPIADISESMEDKSESNVTSDDKANLQAIVDTVTELLKDEELPAEEKAALEKAEADAEALLIVIENADKAADTGNADKVEDVTADNVTPGDKTDLEKAKADLEKALKDNNGNYTAEEKKAIEDELKRIDDALKVIENVEAVEAAISELPATVVPDDEENVAKIEAAKKAYDALSTYEKSLVSKQTKDTLDKLTAAAVAYDIIKGDGSEWTEGSNKTLSFTANGAVSRLLGIEINGKTVDPKHYEVKAGSTIVTLKQDYLDTLEAGKYTITFLYTNGETEGTFIVEAVEEETVPPTTEETVPPTTEGTKPGTAPETGDNANVMLWTTMLLFSVMAITALVVYNKKFAYRAKYVRK